MDGRAGVDLFDQGISPLSCGTRANTLKPTLQMWEVVQILALALVGDNPGVAGHIGNGVVPSNEVALLQMFVQHAVETASLTHIAVDRVLDFDGCIDI